MKIPFGFLHIVHVFAECFISLSLTCMSARLSQLCHWAQKHQMPLVLGSRVAHEGQVPPVWRREKGGGRREDRRGRIEEGEGKEERGGREEGEDEEQLSHLKYSNAFIFFQLMSEINPRNF